MITYVLRKLLLAIPLLLCILTFIFILVELSPGDITDKYITDDTPPEYVEHIRKKYHLDEPMAVRYFFMMRHIVVFDFGRSMTEGREVSEIIWQNLPNTLVLSSVTLLILFPTGILLGTIQAVRQNTPVDTTLSVGSLVVYSMPAFWLAMMLQLIFGIYWSEWFGPDNTLPILGMKDDMWYDDMSGPEKLMDRLQHLILPAFAMGVAGAASTARYMRSSLLGIIRQDFIRTARAKGLSERAVVIRHGMRNALLPIVTLIGLYLPFLFSGSILVELVFGWPGMGRVIYSAITEQDTPVLIGCFYVYTVIVVAGNLLSDITYAWVDPRIRLS